MPIYEYRCGTCGHELEAMQKFSDPLLTRCPACSQDALVKLVSAAGFQLKGGGWYATDFKGNGARPATKPEPGKSESGKESGKSEGGDPGSKGDGESKPAAACGSGCACH